MIRLADHIEQERVLDLSSRTRDAALLELVESISLATEVLDKEKLLRALLEREQIVSTGIGLGLAVPHAKIPEVTDFVVAYGRSQEGIDWGSIDDRPVHHVVVIAGPPDRQHRYLQFLASVTLQLKKEELRLALAGAPDREGLWEVLRTS
jgi:mannitol/fructose-specific phosphotransferase system IIA component (Ntr-type)